MAESARRPESVNCEEVDLSTVVVKMVIPGLAVEKKFLGSNRPKKGVADVDMKFEASSLEMNATISDKKGSSTKYCYRVNKLPGEITPESCKTEYKKDLIILTLKKAEEMSWAVMLSSSGLDQAPSDS